MTMRRTKRHDTANDFDLELYRLMRRAAEMCDLDAVANDRKQYDAWSAAWEHLRQARTVVRGKLMHPSDVERTSGGHS